MVFSDSKLLVQKLNFEHSKQQENKQLHVAVFVVIYSAPHILKK